jgi:hypothetical protein
MERPDCSRTRSSTRAGLGSTGRLLHGSAVTWVRLASSTRDGGRNVGAAGGGGYRFASVSERGKLSISLDLPGAGGEVWARWCRKGRLVIVCADASRRERGPLIAEILEVGTPALWRAVPAESCIARTDARRWGSAQRVINETIVVGFLDPFVDDGAGPGVYHLVAEDGRLIGKCTGTAHVAAGFGEEDRDAVLGGVLLQGDVARGLVSSISTPVST